TPLVPALGPMTGMAFILFTFYMVTDPATSPSDYKGQVLFGTAMAAAYGMLVSLHIVFGLFFGLTLVCALRGFGIYVLLALAERSGRRAASVKPAAVAAATEV